MIFHKSGRVYDELWWSKPTLSSFLPSMVSLLSTKLAVVSIPDVVIVVFLFSSPEAKEKKTEKWTLDGLLKLCNIKSQTDVLSLFMLVAFSRAIGGGHF